MTSLEWIELARNHGEDLQSLIAEYHPSARVHAIRHEMEITAQAAERACELVREEIVREDPSDPVKRFVLALATGNVLDTYDLLNEAWFGVPESTSCWGIRGFKEAVELLEDPPEQEQNDSENE